MKLKTVFGLILITALLVACGGDEPATTEPTVALIPTVLPAVDDPTAEPAVQPTDAPVSDEPTAEPIAEPTANTQEPAATFDLGGESVLIAVENAYLPFNYILFDTGEVGGWDYDAWNAICGILNCVPEFAEEPWDSLVTSVRDGIYDVGADGLEVTESNAQFVDFSDPYIAIDQRLMVRSDDTRFASVDAFKNGDGVLGVTLASESGELAQEMVGDARVRTYDIFEAGVSALIDGSIDGLLIEETAGLGYFGANAESVTLIGEPLASRYLAFAFPKGSPLIPAVNHAIAQLDSDGTFDQLASTYFSPAFTVSYDQIGPGAYGESADSGELPDLGGIEIKIAVENGNLPFNYILAANSQAGGWDYDAWGEICSLINCVPVFEEAPFGGMVQAVADGTYDVAANGIIVSQGRAQVVDFSSGYLSIDQRLLVRLFEDRFSSVEQIAGGEYAVGVEVFTASHDAALEALPFEQIKEYDFVDLAVADLVAGTIDGVITDEVSGQGFVGANSDQVDFLGEVLFSEQFAFAFAKGSPLVAPVNAALNEMSQNGTLETLTRKYFSNEFTVTENDIQ